MTPQDALKALNEAAYVASAALRQASDPRAALAKEIALKTDDLVEGLTQ